MKKLISLLIIAVMLTSLIVISSADGIDGSPAPESSPSSAAVKLYVAPDGDDSADGSEAHPLASFEGARDKIRTIKKNGLPSGGIDVYFAEGTYYFDHTVGLNHDADTGSDDCRIRYIGLGNVTFSGGHTLDNADFVPVTDEAVLEKLDESARDKVLEFDLTILDEIGIDWGRDHVFDHDDREYPFENILFVDSATYIIARYPNADDGFAKILGAYKASEDEDDQTYWVQIDKAAGQKIAGWDFSKGIRDMGYYIQTYLYEASNVHEFEERDGEYWVLMDHPDTVLYSRPILADGAATRIAFYNAIEALDVPGEYYIDKDAAKMYVVPGDNFASAEIVIPIMQDDCIISTDYANNITFDNINFKYGWHNALNITGLNIEVRNCEISNFFGVGIKVLGHDNLFDSNVIHDVGTKCIDLVSDHYLFNHSVQDQTEITNNEFYNWCLKDTWCQYAVAPIGSGMRIANNFFHDGKFGAIGPSTDSLIEYNIFTRVNTEVYDDAAIHAGQHEYDGATVIRYNYFYDCGCNGIYWDNWGAHEAIYGNILVNIGNGLRHVIQGYGIIINGGYDCNVQNNILVNCYSASISLCSRIMWPGIVDSYDSVNNVRYNPHSKLVVPTMLLINENLRGVAHPDCIDSVGYLIIQNNVAYSTTKSFRQYEGYNLGVARSYDGPRGISDEFTCAGTTFRNNTLSDVYPEFVNRDGDISDPMSFSLRDDSVIYSILPGFERIPVEKIGIGNYDK